MKTPLFDIAIVGAGPGGIAAAIYAALNGLQVILLESLTQPEQRPGESHPPRIETIFKQLGVWQAIDDANFIRHIGHYIHDGQQNKFHIYSSDQKEKWRGFQIPRQTLEDILQKRALELGAVFIKGCRIKKIVQDHDHINLVSHDQQTIRARHAIDASGVAHLFIRYLKIDMLYYSPKLIARYGYMTDSPPFTTLPLFSKMDNGWMWYAKITNQRYAWVHVDELANKKLSPIHHMIDGGADVSWRIGKQLAGPHFFLVGDAACVLDPAASHGILRAMMSGIMAADSILNIAKNRISPSNAYINYQYWLNNWFMQDVEKLRKRNEPMLTLID